MKLIGYFLSLSILTGFGATFAREYSAAGFARSSDLEMIRILSEAPARLRAPLSVRAQREVFEACATVQGSLFLGIQSVETRDMVALNCSALADAALARNPTLSAAHATKALFATDSNVAARAVVASWMTAPYDAWEARLRILRGFALQDMEFEEVAQVVAADVAFMMQAHTGRMWLAQFYWSDPAIQPALINLVETRPNDEQAAFLSQVRRHAR
ncbi:MAG: hypothetical protein JJU08_18415 [Rhodobacteraceae bacterium]|nr:hypothetical protein [Paracoccaceae bacterium]